jgi:hypothetical protein
MLNERSLETIVLSRWILTASLSSGTARLPALLIATPDIEPCPER